MPRLPAITDRDALPEADRAAYDYLVQTRGNVRAPFSVILNAPDICQRVAHVGSYVRFESSLPEQTVELATLTAAREGDCTLQWIEHTRLALSKGVRQEAIDVIGHRWPLDGLSDDEALPIRCSREILHDHRLSDATFEAAKARYGAKGVIDLISVGAYYFMLGCLINGLEIASTNEGPPLP